MAIGLADADARFAAGSGLILSLIISSMASLKSQNIEPSFSLIWNLGFKANSALIRHSSWMRDTYTRADLIGNSLVINSPQLIASFLYIFCHNILRRQVVSDEWVTLLKSNGQSSIPASPAVSLQGDGHFLSLPLKYGLPLHLSSKLLCWLISQSIFHVQLSYFSPGPDGVRLSEYDMSVQGYSMLASISALGLGTLMMLALVGNSLLRSYNDIPPGFQLMGMSSAAIALMTWRSWSATDAHLLPIGIGIVSDRETDAFRVSGRLVVSTDTNLRRPVEGSRYILPAVSKRSIGTAN